MAKKTVAAIVRENVQALRDSPTGARGQRTFAEKCGIGEGTVWRISKGQDGTSIETLRAIAEAHGLQAWQLLVPGLDPVNPPVLAPLTDAERRLYAAIKAANVNGSSK